MKKLAAVFSVVLFLAIVLVSQAQDWDGLWAFIGPDGNLTRSVTLRPGEAVSVVAPPPNDDGEPLCSVPGGGYELNGSFIVFAVQPGTYEFKCGFGQYQGNINPLVTLTMTVSGEPVPGFEDNGGQAIRISSSSSGVLSDSAGCVNCTDIGRRVAIYRSEEGGQYEYRVESLVDNGTGGWEAGSTICRSSTRLVEGVDCSGLTTGGMGVEIDIILTKVDVTYVVWVGGEKIVYGPYPLSVEG